MTGPVQTITHLKSFHVHVVNLENKPSCLGERKSSRYFSDILNLISICTKINFPLKFEEAFFSILDIIRMKIKLSPCIQGTHKTEIV